MDNFNKDLCHYIMRYLELKDKSKIGILNKHFNWIWSNYLVLDAIKITEGYKYANYRFILLPNRLKMKPFIGILNKCTKFKIPIAKITMDYIYLSYDERKKFEP